MGVKKSRYSQIKLIVCVLDFYKLILLAINIVLSQTEHRFVMIEFKDFVVLSWNVRGAASAGTKRQLSSLGMRYLWFLSWKHTLSLTR